MGSLEKYSILFPEKGHFFLISLLFLECSGRACESIGGDRVAAMMSSRGIVKAILSRKPLELLVKK
jgi:hypothetical protein